MSMFSSYDNLPLSVIPNNTFTENVSFDSFDAIAPRPVYNVRGTFVGYSWNYGEVFDLTLSATTTINVAEDSLVYQVHGQGPDATTPGRAGQLAYNLVDTKSWVCVGVADSINVWVEDEEITFPSNGSKSITFTPVTDEDTLEFTLYNHRWEELKSFAILGANEIKCSVDANISNSMKPSVYYGILKVTGTNKNQVISKLRFTVE